MDTNLEEVDLVIVDLQTIMTGVTIMERLCLEARGDHQVTEVNLCHKEMVISVIVANMNTLKESVTRNRMTHKEVEDVVGHNIHIFISEVVIMVVKDCTKVIIYFPCNKYLTV